MALRAGRSGGSRRSSTPSNCPPIPAGQLIGQTSSASASRHLIHQLERRAPLAIDLVDEGDDRHRPHPAHLEQLPRLRLDPLGGVNHHDRRIHRRQRAISILREILMPRRIEQVEGQALAFKGHHRTGNRNPALLLDLHPIRPRPPRRPARLDLPGKMDRAALQQQLLGQRGLARVRMRDDGKGAAAGKGRDRHGGRLDRCRGFLKCSLFWGGFRDGKGEGRKRPGAFGPRPRFCFRSAPSATWRKLVAPWAFMDGVLRSKGNANSISEPRGEIPSGRATA